MDSREKKSRIPGFYTLSPIERMEKVRSFAGLTEEDITTLMGTDGELIERVDKMIENVVGRFYLPIGFAANFRIDDIDHLVPMVIEEPSVVAAASHAAKLLRSGQGIATESTASLMIGQIQLQDMDDLEIAATAIENEAARLVELANAAHPRIVARGGGARSLTVRRFPESEVGPMLIVHLLVDVCDAMGANLVNGMVEILAPECESIVSGCAYLRILSNLADQRLVHAVGRVPLQLLERPKLELNGREVAERIVRASVFAELDPYRAATHNKGIMNGIDAFLLATGQDWRAIEAGAHAFASQKGHYTALATWRIDNDTLVGRLTMPMQVGTVGGIVAVHPVVKVLLRTVGAESASDVARIAGAVGLAQNLAAILALATEGIQRGHMSLHARNIAAAAGADADQIDRIVAEMIRRRSIDHASAASLLHESQTGENETRGTQSEDDAIPYSMEGMRGLRDTYWPKIESLVEEIISPDDSLLAKMLWYQLGTGGKRLRALMPLIAYDAMGQSASEIVPLAAAIELLHNATLIHGDAEERIRTRRGHDTLWLRYGLDQAINAGDGIFYVALECLDRLPHPSEKVRAVERMIRQRMLRITTAQVRAREQGSSLEQRIELTRDRIGGLFSLAIPGAAFLAGADAKTVERLEEIGGHLGVIFKIQDELMDICGKKPGVTMGARVSDGRIGLLFAHCLKNGSPEDRELLQTILGKPHRDTSELDIQTAFSMLRTHGSLAFGVDLITSHQQMVESISDELGYLDLTRALRATVDLFLAPLLTDRDLV